MAVPVESLMGRPGIQTMMGYQNLRLAVKEQRIMAARWFTADLLLLRLF
jgi:hypothetical protein